MVPLLRGYPEKRCPCSISISLKLTDESMEGMKPRFFKKPTCLIIFIRGALVNLFFVIRG